MTRSASSDVDKRAGQLLKRLDRNTDERVSMEEIKFPLTEKIFNENNTDDDGYLSRTEIVDYLNKRQG